MKRATQSKTCVGGGWRSVVEVLSKVCGRFGPRAAGRRGPWAVGRGPGGAGRGPWGAPILSTPSTDGVFMYNAAVFSAHMTINYSFAHCTGPLAAHKNKTHGPRSCHEDHRFKSSLVISPLCRRLRLCHPCSSCRNRNTCRAPSTGSRHIGHHRTTGIR